MLDEAQSRLKFGDMRGGSRVMGIQQREPFPDGLLPLSGKACVPAHLAHAHAGVAQADQEEQPAHVVCVVDAPPAGIASHARHQSLLLIPADRVHAAAGLASEPADMKARAV
nr:hypothetical protein [Steroidobacter gossypii]